VQKMEPEKLFSFTCTPTPSTPRSTTRASRRRWSEFRLEAKGGGTLLILTESGFDAIPKDGGSKPSG